MKKELTIWNFQKYPLFSLRISGNQLTYSELFERENCVISVEFSLACMNTDLLRTAPTASPNEQS